MKSIEAQIGSNARINPNKVALISGSIEVSYEQLWQQCCLAATNIKEKYKLQQGDRIILSAGASIEFIYAYFGIHLAGGICVPIDPDTNETRFGYIYESTRPRCVMGTLHKTNCETLPFDTLLTPSDTNLQKGDAFFDFDQVADILFTTGTTGAPKGVSLSHKNLSAAANNINTFIQNTANDIELLALPVSHSFGLGRVRCVLTKGGTLVLLGSFANMKKFYSEMARCHVTGFGMVPASWGFFKKMSGNYIGKFSTQLKYIEIGSSFMPTEDKQLLNELLPNTRINMHYGLTEASRSAFMEFHTEQNNLTTAGKSAPNVDIAIFDDSGKKLGINTEGEVCVKGDHVCCSYWNESSSRFENDFYSGYFRTGDCGYIDEHGYLYLKSRIKEMINVGGKKVSPMEVEEIINRIPGVRESVCIGIPDPDGVLGEVVKAFIVSDIDTLSKDYLVEQLRPHLELYKTPVSFERIDEVPKTASGKIQRLKLKK